MTSRTELARGHRFGLGALGASMLKLDLPLFILVGSLVIGAFVGFLEAQRQNMANPGSFIGVWFAAGISVAAIALVPVLIAGMCWNSMISRLFGERRD